MWRWILVVVTFLFGINDALATHAAGADLVYEHITGNTYRFTLSFYRDCGGSTANPTYTISYAGCAGAGNFTVAQIDVQEITPLCPTQNSECSSGTIFGINRHVYTGTVTLPGNCTDWEFDFCVNARNGTIDVINNPGSQQLCVEATLDNQTVPSNSSANFGSDPVSIICSNSPYCMNFFASDDDGDSLSYELITPLNDASGGTVTYIAPYTQASPLSTDPSDPFTLGDNGTICFTPNLAMTSVAAVRVSEWRNGVVIGSVVRDIQVEINGCTNSSPVPLGYDGNPIAMGGTNINMDFCVGDSINLMVSAQDADPGQTVTLTFDNSIQGAVFTDNGNGTGILRWVATMDNVGSYCFNIRATDDNCPYTSSFVQEYCFDINEAVIAGAMNTDTICGNMSSNLFATGSGNLTWSVLSGDPINVGVNFTCNPCANPIATPNATTMYRVVSDASFGICNNADTIEVIVLQNLGNINTTLPDTLIACENSCELVAGVSTITPTSINISSFVNDSNYNFNHIDTTFSPVSVTGLPVALQDGNVESVCLSLNHINIDEVRLVLFSPAGSAFTLVQNQGGTGDNMTNTCFEVGAVTNITAGAAPFTGSFIAQGGNISTEFTGENPNGTWRLALIDNTGTYACGFANLGTCSDDGELLEWSINFYYEPQPPTFNWNPTTGVSDASIVNPTICPDYIGDSLYVVTTFDENMCFIEDSILVRSNAEPVLTATIVNEDCRVGNGSIALVLTNLSGNETHNWEEVANPGVSISSTTGVTSQDAGDFLYEFEDLTTGCEFDSVITINLDDNNPVLTLTNIVHETCLDDSLGMITLSTNSGSGTYSYDLINIANTTGDLNGVYSGLTSDNHNFYVTDGVTGCQDSIQIPVNPGQNISFTFTVAASTCGLANGSISLTALGATGIVHSILGDTLVNYIGSNTFNNISAGVYDTWIQSPIGCKAQATIMVNDNPGQTFDPIITAPTTCAYDSTGMASISLQAGSAPFTYLINGDTVAIGQPATQVYTSVPAGTHIVTSIDNNNCLVSDTFTVNPGPTVLVEEIPDTSICQGGVAQLSLAGSGGIGAYQYYWGNDLGNFVNLSNNLVGVAPDSTTVFNYFILDNNGCSSDTLDIQVAALDSLAVTIFDDSTVCAGQRLVYYAQVSGGQSPYTYSWGGSGGSVSSVDSLVWPSIVGSESVLLTVGDGCETPSVQTQFEVTVVPMPSPVIQADVTTGCEPLTVSFTNGTPGSMSCLWDFGDGNFSQECDVTHIFEGDSCSNVMLTVTDTNFCSGTSAVPTTICRDQKPIAYFTYDPVTIYTSNPEVSFNNASSGADTYLWNFGDGGTSFEVNPVHEYPDVADTIDVQLIAYSTYLCPDTAYSVIIIREELVFYMANSFSPNGDNINDVFTPVMTQGYDPNNYYLFSVYDRWGERVFQTENPKLGWDGTYWGKTMESDVYVWKLELRTTDFGERQTHFGHVMLVR